MATLKEKEELIEVLKFTPRTYKVRLWGYGGEYVMGTVDRKVYDYFRHHRLSLSDYAWGGEEFDSVPEEMQPFSPGSWHDCDNLGHCWGVDRNSGTLQVEDENGNVIYEKELESITGGGEYEDPPEPEWGGNEEVWIDSQPKGTVVFIGTSSEKGTFFEADLELKTPFNAGKLCLHYDEIDGNEIINSVSYDGEELVNDGGDTSGKSSDFGFYIAGSSEGTGKFERYRDMDDIEYGLSEWFPVKNNPDKLGKYNVKTKEGYNYQAIWNGKYWHNEWNEDKIKVTEWQGIAYDPDTHNFYQNEKSIQES